MIRLDGSHGEGGGAILRQALALSMHTGKAFEITNIRANRPEPGMKMQHLTALNACQRLCNAKVKGNQVGSTEVSFEPGELKEGNLKLDIGTAGSITLLLQSFLLPCLFSGSQFKFEITGGTDVKWSQPIDYFTHVLIPHLKKYGDTKVDLIKRGYFPKGNGIVKISIKGNRENSLINLVERTKLLQIKGISHASSDLQSSEVAERQAKNAEIILSSYGPVNISEEYVQTDSSGSGITLWSIYGDDEEGINFANPVILGSDALGEPSKTAEKVGEEAARALKREIDSGAAVDKYLADQLIPFLGVKGGKIKTSEVTKHALSNIYVAEKFLDVKFKVEDNIISV